MRLCVAAALAVLPAVAGCASPIGTTWHRTYENRHEQAEVGDLFRHFRPGVAVLDHREPFAALWLDLERYNVPALVAIAEDPARRVWDRTEAIRLLGYLRPTEAFDPLVRCLRAGEDAVVMAAVLALGDYGDRRAVQPLLGVLERPPTGTIEINCGVSPDTEQHWVKVSGVDSEFAFFLSASPSSSRGVERTLSVAIVQALGRLRSREAVPLLTGVLEASASDGERVASADALGRIGDPAALPALQRVHEAAQAGGSAKLAEWTELAIERIHSAGRSQEGLMEDTTSGSAHVVYCAVRALGERGDRAAIASLRKLCSDGREVRRDALPPTVIETIGQAARDAVAAIEARSSN